jgi:hypothetical protein
MDGCLQRKHGIEHVQIEIGCKLDFTVDCGTRNFKGTERCFSEFS